MKKSALQRVRAEYQPKLPETLKGAVKLKFGEPTESVADQEEIKSRFPHTYGMPVVEFERDENPTRVEEPFNVGIILSGGQAPGGHNVVSGIFDGLKSLNKENRLYGFLMGPSGFINHQYMELTAGIIKDYRNTGGFDMIGSGRDKIKGDEQFAASARVCAELELDGLIIIGGDDSNTNAALLAEYFQSIHHRTHVIGCPKTIDGDLKNDYIPLSFGFDTACKIYSELIGNICVDALSAQKYYHFVRLMGRSASHITMECAFETHPNYTFIGEEIKAKAKSVREITQEVVDLIVARAKLNKNYGVILLPEGLIEFIPEMGALIGELNDVIAAGHTEQADIASHLSEASRALFEYLPQTLKNQLTLDRDSHGNVKVSQIETEKFIVSCVEKELAELKKQGKYSGSFNSLCHFFGYEGRCGLPSCFDTNYCYALGYNAGILLSLIHISEPTRPY